MRRHNFGRIFRFLLVLLGNCLYALTVKLFLLPAGLISTGTTGIALTVNHLTGFPMPVFILLFNLLMLGLGLALGMVIRGGASTGGMDIPPLILHKKFRIPVSVSLWCFDFCIVLSQMLYHTAEDLLYGILLLIVTSVALNKILLFGTAKIEIKVISPEAVRIRDAILSQADRGVTLLHGEGGYLHVPSEVLLSVVSAHELPKIEQLIRDIDPECFMVISQVTEVWGRGFSLGKRYADGISRENI